MAAHEGPQRLAAGTGTVVWRVADVESLGLCLCLRSVVVRRDDATPAGIKRPPRARGQRAGAARPHVLDHSGGSVHMYLV